ncbi:MAG: SOS response-associated peptidase family protein [Rhodospirillaceae bacterium]
MCVALAAHHTWQAMLAHYTLQPGAEPVAQPGAQPGAQSNAQPGSGLIFTPSAVIRPKAAHPIIRSALNDRGVDRAVDNAEPRMNTRVLDLARWGFPGAKGRSTPVTSARCETLDVLPKFRDAFQTQRCVVPVSGYYAWKREVDGTRTPWRFSRQNSDPESRNFESGITDSSLSNFIAIAGLYRFNRTSRQYQFVVITTEPNEIAAEIHDRMPVILTEEGVDTWLSLNTGRADLRALCKPYDGDDLTAQPVAKSLFERPKTADKNQLSLKI